MSEESPLKHVALYTALDALNDLYCSTDKQSEQQGQLDSNGSNYELLADTFESNDIHNDSVSKGIQSDRKVCLQDSEISSKQRRRRKISHLVKKKSSLSLENLSPVSTLGTDTDTDSDTDINTNTDIDTDGDGDGDGNGNGDGDGDRVILWVSLM